MTLALGPSPNIMTDQGHVVTGHDPAHDVHGRDHLEPLAGDLGVIVLKAHYGGPFPVLLGTGQVGGHHLVLRQENRIYSPLPKHGHWPPSPGPGQPCLSRLLLLCGMDVSSLIHWMV